MRHAVEALRPLRHLQVPVVGQAAAPDGLGARAQRPDLGGPRGPGRLRLGLLPGALGLSPWPPARAQSRGGLGGALPAGDAGPSAAPRGRPRAAAGARPLPEELHAPRAAGQLPGRGGANPCHILFWKGHR